MDELDIEVTPIGAAASGETAHADGTPALRHERVPTVPAAPSASRHSRPPRRLLRTLAVTLVIVVALVAILWVPAGTRAVFTQLAARPTSSPTSSPPVGSDRFLWEHTVPWGTLFIDGHPGPDVRAAVVSYDASGMLQARDFRLPRGKHTLEYRAAQFPTLRCVVSVPRAATDSCPLDFQNTDMFVMDAPGIRVLDLRATVDRLSADQAQTVATLAQAALDAAALANGQDAVAPGDHLLGADGQPQVATTAWRVEARFTIDGNAGVLDRPGEFTSCAPLCAYTSLFASRSGSAAWAVYAPVALTWRYLTPAGAVALDNGPALPATASVSVVTELAVHWQNTQWQVGVATAGQDTHDPVICAFGQHALEVLRASLADAPAVDPYAQFTAAPLAHGLGCLYTLTVTGGSGATATPDMSARVLYRCGALVAVNVAAQRLFPHLPHPSDHELALAQAASR